MTPERRAALTARDEALNDDATLHRALRIIKIFYLTFGHISSAKRLLNELTDILIAVRARARERHQDAERTANQLLQEELGAQLL